MHPDPTTCKYACSAEMFGASPMRDLLAVDERET